MLLINRIYRYMRSQIKYVISIIQTKILYSRIKSDINVGRFNVIFSMPRGKGDYAIYSSCVINLANKFKQKKYYVYVDCSRAKVYKSFAFPPNVILRKYHRLYNDDVFLRKLLVLDKHYTNLLLIKFMTNSDIYIKQNLYSVHDVIWKCFFGQSDNITPLPPRRVPLKKSSKAKKQLKRYGDYIIINTNAISLNLSKGNDFFVSLIKLIKEKYEINILINGAKIQGFKSLNSCDFQELYYFVLFSKCTIGVRSGLEDFSIGTNTPLVSIIPDNTDYDWCLKYFDLKYWKMNDSVFQIKYREMNFRDCINEIDLILEKLLIKKYNHLE